jgi:hypothetical protein
MGHAATWMMGARYFDRYGICAIISLTIFLAYALYFLAEGSERAAQHIYGILFTGFVALFIAPFISYIAGSFLGRSPADHRTVSMEDTLRASTLPIAVLDYSMFFQLDYYGDASLASRAYFVSDPELAEKWTGNNEFDISIPRINQRVALRSHVSTVAEFLRSNQRFLVLGRGRPWEWFLRHLRAEGNDCRLVEFDIGWTLHEVRIKE